MENQSNFEWNREVILGGKTYGINDSKKEIRNIYKTQEEQEKDDKIEPLFLDEEDKYNMSFFKNAFLVTQEELVNWAFYGTAPPVQDFFIAFDSVDNILLMADLLDLKDSKVNNIIRIALYSVTRTVLLKHLNVNYGNQEIKEFSKILKYLKENNPSQELEKWVDRSLYVTEHVKKFSMSDWSYDSDSRFYDDKIYKPE